MPSRRSDHEAYLAARGVGPFPPRRGRADRSKPVPVRLKGDWKRHQAGDVLRLPPWRADRLIAADLAELVAG